MTRKEALEWFKDRKKMNLDDKCQQAEDMAIKVLKQEICDDCVSRQAVVELLRDHSKDFEDVRIKMAFIAASSLVENTEYIPPVTPTQRWIPVSEGLPNAQKDDDKDFSDWVQVTINLGENNDVVSEAYYCFSEQKWYTERFVIGKVIAWMPSPKPYNEESGGMEEK